MTKRLPVRGRIVAVALLVAGAVCRRSGCCRCRSGRTPTSWPPSSLFTSHAGELRARCGPAHFPASFVNSLLASGGSTAFSLLLGVPAAYALARWRFRGHQQIALWILATRMAPPIAFTIPFFLAYHVARA